MNHEQIEAVVGVLRESSRLTEIEIRVNDTTLRVRRPAPPAPRQANSGRTAAPGTSPSAAGGGGQGAAEGPPAEAGLAPHPEPVTVTAHLVGVFHAARPLVGVGETVGEKQPLGQIEVMRLMNDCLAPVAGRVRAVLVGDGQPVEYGQPLFEIAPEGT